MYNIPPNLQGFTVNTCGGSHVDNVLDSFGLQINYEYFNNDHKGSDHSAVLVTLLDAEPIFNVKDLNLIYTKLPTVVPVIPVVGPILIPTPVPATVHPTRPKQQFCYI